MTRRSTLLSAILLVGGTLSVIGAQPALPASAAGGEVPYQLPSAFPASPYPLSLQVKAAYSGRYALQQIDQRSRITEGTLGITIEPNGSLLGIVQLYGHDQQGYKTSLLMVLSNFQPLAHGRMAIELFDTAGQDLQDALTVTRTASGDLAGQLHMDGQRYAIRWQKIAAGLS